MALQVGEVVWIPDQLSFASLRRAEEKVFRKDVEGSAKNGEILSMLMKKLKAKKQSAAREKANQKVAKKSTAKKEASRAKKSAVIVGVGVQEEAEIRAKATKSPPRRMPSITRMERDIRFVLMDLMCGSESDSVRVAAAKALMDKVNKVQGEETDERENSAKERDAAIDEASRLLAELAALKSCGARHKAKVA